MKIDGTSSTDLDLKSITEKAPSNINKPPGDVGSVKTAPAATDVVRVTRNNIVQLAIEVEDASHTAKLDHLRKNIHSGTYQVQSSELSLKLILSLMLS